MHTLANLNLSLYASIAALLLMGCNKKSITSGHKTLSGVIGLQTTKYTVKSLSQKNLHAASKSNAVTYGLLGSLQQENIGVSTYSFATQFRLPTSGASFGENAIIDSVVLYIPVANTSDSVSNILSVPSDIDVVIHALDEKMKPRDSAYHSDYKFKVATSPLSPQKTTWGHILDSVKYVDTKEKVKTKAPGLNVLLDNSYFTKNFLPLSVDQLKDNSKFIEAFKGLYISCSENPMGFVTKFNLLGATLTLHHKNKDGDKKTITFTVNAFASRVNLVAFETEKIQTLEKSSDKSYLQALIGLKPVISLLDKNEIKSLRDSNIVLSQARLHIERHENDKSKYFPKTLTIYQNNSPISESRSSSFGGKEDKGKYYFNITNLVQKVLKKGDTATSLKINIHALNDSQSIDNIMLDNSKTKLELHYGK